MCSPRGVQSIVESVQELGMLAVSYDALREESNSLYNRALNGYRKGEEVLISYGLMPNDELLLRYGFVDDQNVADTYQFEGLLPYLMQNDPTLKENLEKNPNFGKG